MSKLNAQQGNQNSGSLGVWIIGGRGAVSSSAILGVFALRKNLIDTTGMVTETSPFKNTGLCSIDSLIFGGHDPSHVSLAETVLSLGREALDPKMIEALSEDLKSAQSNMVEPPRFKMDRAPIEFVTQVQEDIQNFKKKFGLNRVVVVNLASTEPVLTKHQSHEFLPDFEKGLNQVGTFTPEQLPMSVLYAYAAIDAGYPYINFTPSTGACIPALNQLALEKNLPLAGSDGKTGETLLKTALAPMFAQRALKIQSWVGYNILGNGDGKSLSDPNNVKSKLQTKAGVLGGILGYEPFSHVAIDYVPSIGDWKTATDLVQFQGFFGTSMTFNFTWRGCDSLLAAPLVLDLIRLTDLAHRKNEKGPLEYLGFFFKNPMASQIHDLSKQYELLVGHVCHN